MPASCSSVASLCRSMSGSSRSRTMLTRERFTEICNVHTTPSDLVFRQPSWLYFEKRILSSDVTQAQHPTLINNMLWRCIPSCMMCLYTIDNKLCGHAALGLTCCMSSLCRARISARISSSGAAASTSAADPTCCHWSCSDPSECPAFHTMALSELQYSGPQKMAAAYKSLP